MRYDVPVVGLDTLDVLEECHVSLLSLEARKTLILDKEEFLKRADNLGIAVVGESEEE